MTGGKTPEALLLNTQLPGDHFLLKQLAMRRSKCYRPWGKPDMTVPQMLSVKDSVEEWEDHLPAQNSDLREDHQEKLEVLTEERNEAASSFSERRLTVKESVKE